MSSAVQKFVLVGIHKGKTMTVNGHEFVDGVFVFQGSITQIASLTKIFGYYSAVPSEVAELADARAAITAQAGAAVGGSMDKPTPPAEPMPTLAEAIGQLNWEQETHWTSNNLPATDFLASIIGKKVTRAEVEAVAPDYTRSKAKLAKAMQ
jgi:hypothetical protein